MTPTDHISVPYPTRSKLITSGATNSGVPKRTFNCFVGSNLLAKPKSMILIRCPSRLTQRIFSG